MATIDADGWDVGHPAVHREYLTDTHGARRLAMLRHPSYPFSKTIEYSNHAEFVAKVLEVADFYLCKVRPIEPQIPYDLHSPEGFGWLPLSWRPGRGGLEDPRGSFEVWRRLRTDPSIDRTIVLMAAERSLKTQADKSCERAVVGAGISLVNGRQVGLRVVAHVEVLPGRRKARLRITGLSMIGLEQLLKGTKSSEFLSVQSQGESISLEPLIINALASLKMTLLLSNATFRGIEASMTEVRISGGGTDNTRQCCCNSYIWQLNGHPNKNEDGFWDSHTKVLQATDAVAEASARRLFLRDPASAGDCGSIALRYPTRECLLDLWSKPRNSIPNLLQYPADGSLFKVLERPEPGEDCKVLKCPEPGEDCLREATQRIQSGPLPLRSDHLAAAHAFRRAHEFFGLMRSFGFEPAAYFKFARLPLLLRHRASFARHPDGKVVNAQVCLSGATTDLYGAFNADDRPRLEVRFGSAALRHRYLIRDDHNRLTAQPLGLAADPRWAWHEFGHVLSYAAGAALEFEFAHSAGDALAAVLADPLSKLANHPDVRGRTFPWVPTHRRHDRTADEGWGWCGHRNGQRRAEPIFPPRLRKGYTEEQMLSSSVFRLYRAIGGDTFSSALTRMRAARHCAYLIVRAIALLGPSPLVPVRSADAFVSAMIDADIGTRHTFPQRRGYAGGCVSKVVRWAFEQQGLYATDDPERVIEGPGRPPRVDLWIKNRRPTADGGYDPVPLLWGGGDQPWHADSSEQGMQLTADGKLHVRVRNRGWEPAANVEVHVWVAIAASDLTWQLVGSAEVASVGAGNAESVEIDPAGRLPEEPYYLFAAATCPGDRSNLDRASELPCATGNPPPSRRQIPFIVACDNNLAFRSIGT